MQSPRGHECHGDYEDMNIGEGSCAGLGEVVEFAGNIQLFALYKDNFLVEFRKEFDCML